MKLIICTGIIDHCKQFISETEFDFINSKSIDKVKYCTIDSNLLPFEQIDEMDDLLNTNKESYIVMFNNSPYIWNYLNLLIKRFDSGITESSLSYDDIYAYLIEYDYENNKIISQDLKILNKRLIYTDPLSDPIDWIYDSYRTLK